MVLTKSELIASLQNEVTHPAPPHRRSRPCRKVDYRPTPKQRSILELLRYLSIMGPALVQAGNAGVFDPGRVQGDHEGR